MEKHTNTESSKNRYIMFINIILKHFYKGGEKGIFFVYLDYKRGTLNIDNTHARTKKGER